MSEWFASHIDDVVLPLRISLIAGGTSNLTYRVDDAAGATFVLRRPPIGIDVATAHDVAREHRIISALADTTIPVPRARGLCEDHGVNGAPFYVMDFVDGPVLHDDARAASALDVSALVAGWATTWSRCSPISTPSIPTPWGSATSGVASSTSPASSGAGAPSGRGPRRASWP
ncbi:MAG: phosphotransferase [Acidimicrobiia bacterium]|nr:phosphotransferase [Acidimicrobiia bacterium]